jgi:hypothetical protein
MRKRTLILFVVCLLGCLSIGTLSLCWPTVTNCNPHGTLVYQGSPAPVGIRLEAKILDVVVAETTVTTSGHYAISIPPDDLQTAARDGWQDDDLITIWIDDYKAQPTFTAFEGSREIDLVVSSIALDVRRSTWGKIKALFR